MGKSIFDKPTVFEKFERYVKVIRDLVAIVGFPVAIAFGIHLYSQQVETLSLFSAEKVLGEMKAQKELYELVIDSLEARLLRKTELTAYQDSLLKSEFTGARYVTDSLTEELWISTMGEGLRRYLPDSGSFSTKGLILPQ